MRELAGARGGMRTRSAPDLIRRGAAGSTGSFWATSSSGSACIRRLQETDLSGRFWISGGGVFGCHCALIRCSSGSISFSWAAYFICAVLSDPASYVGECRCWRASSSCTSWWRSVWIRRRYILRKRAQRLTKFEQQLPDAIDLFNAVDEGRAQHPCGSGDDRAPRLPIRRRWNSRKLMEELGARHRSSKPRCTISGKRVPLIDLKFFITGLILQRQTGANMVDVLENLVAAGPRAVEPGWRR